MSKLTAKKPVGLKVSKKAIFLRLHQKSGFYSWGRLGQGEANYSWLNLFQHPLWDR